MHDPKKFAQPQTLPLWYKKLRLISHTVTDRVIANFLDKKPDFHYYGNRDWSEANVNDKTGPPQKPHLVQKSRKYLLHRLSYRQFSVLFKYPNFHYHGNRACQRQNFNETIKLAKVARKSVQRWWKKCVWKEKAERKTQWSFSVIDGDQYQVKSSSMNGCSLKSLVFHV